MIRFMAPLLMCPGLVVAAPAVAQPAATAALSVNPVSLGQIVQWRIVVPVPAGSIVYFPKTLPATPAFESHGSVEWAAEPAPGGALLKLSYPLIAFGIGRVPTPALAIHVRPAGARAKGAVLPGGSRIGAWKDRQGAAVLAHIPPREARVASLFELEGVLGGVGPMPAADVVGRSVGMAPIALIAASVLIVAGLLVAALRRVRRGEGTVTAGRASSLETARRAALKELDELIALGLHDNGRLREFHTRTSAIIRRYVERFDPLWGPDLTSTELMRGLQARAAAEPVEALSAEMIGAETIKFGPRPSDAKVAEDHWRVVRDWVKASGRRNA